MNNRNHFYLKNGIQPLKVHLNDAEIWIRPTTTWQVLNHETIIDRFEVLIKRNAETLIYFDRLDKSDKQPKKILKKAY